MYYTNGTLFSASYLLLFMYAIINDIVCMTIIHDIITDFGMDYFSLLININHTFINQYFHGHQPVNCLTYFIHFITFIILFCSNNTNNADNGSVLLIIG